MPRQALCIISKPLVISNWSYSPETHNSGKNWQLFVPCDLKIWQMTLKNNRAPLLCYIKVCASFRNHQQFQTGVTVWKCSLRVKIVNFLLCDLEVWRMTFYATSSFVHHLIAIGEFKLRLQSKNTQFGSKLFFSHVTWPWKTTGHLAYVTSSFVLHYIAIWELKMELWSGNG